MRVKRSSILTKIVIVVLLVYAVVSLIRINDRKAQAQEDLADLKRQEAGIAADNDDMQYALEHRDDPEVLEDIAREHGYTYDGEEIYVAGQIG